MNDKSKTSKTLALTLLLSAVFAAGCERRSPDDQTAASGAAGTSSTDTATTAQAGSAGSADTSSSSGASTTPGTSASGSASSDTAPSSGSSDSDTASSDSSGASGSGSSAAAKTGAVVDDSVITTKLKSALLADAEIKGTDVSVDTKQGQVTLTGTVKSEAQKDRIEKIAKGIDGVKDVQDKLTVKQ